MCIDDPSKPTGRVLALFYFKIFESELSLIAGNRDIQTYTPPHLHFALVRPPYSYSYSFPGSRDLGPRVCTLMSSRLPGVRVGSESGEWEKITKWRTGKGRKQKTESRKEGRRVR